MVGRNLSLVMLALAAGLTVAFAAPGEPASSRTGIQRERQWRHESRVESRGASGSARPRHARRHLPPGSADQRLCTGLENRGPETRGGRRPISRRLAPPRALTAGESDSLNCRLVGKFEYSSFGCTDLMCCVAAGDYLFVGGEDPYNRIAVLDISDAANIRFVASAPTGLPAVYEGVASGDYLYVSGYGGLGVLDIRDPRHPALVATLAEPDVANDLAAQSDYLYAATDWGLTVIDVHNPRNPFVAETVYNDVGCYRLAVGGNYIYACYDADVLVFDISTPGRPVFVKHFTVTDDLLDVAADGHHVFFTGANLDVFDISSPASPESIAVLAGASGSNIELAGSLLYESGEAGGLVVDVGNPGAPYVAGAFPNGYTSYDADGLALSGTRVCTVNDYEAISVTDCAQWGPPVVGRVGNWPANGVFVRDSFAYVASSDTALRIVNVARPAAPVVVGRCLTGSEARAVCVKDSFAYVVGDGGCGLSIIKVVSAANPVRVGYRALPGGGYDVCLKDSFAYVAADDSGLRIINVKRPSTPTEVGSYATPGLCRAVAVRDSFAYIGDYTDLRVINVARPASPFEAGLSDSISTVGLTLAAGRLYAVGRAWPYGGSVIMGFDITNPPHLCPLRRTAAQGRKVVVADTFAFTPHTDRCQIFNVARADTIVEVGSIAVPTADLKVAGRYGYAAGCGLCIVDLSHLTGGFRTGAEWIPGDFENQIYDVVSAGDYACIGTDSGVTVLAVADPANPRPVGSFTDYEELSVCDCQGSRLFAQNYGGMLILDISDPTRPSLAGALDGDISAVRANGNFAYYLEASTPGLWIADVGNPSDPTFPGQCVINPGTSVEMGNLAGRGPRVYGTATGVGALPQAWLYAFNVADTLRPFVACSTVVGNYSTPPDVAVWGNFVYVVSPESGLSIYDATNPTRLALRGRYRDSLTTSVCVAVLDSFVFLSCSEAGLRIINVANPAAPGLFGWYRPAAGDYFGIAVSDSEVYVADCLCSSLNIIRPGVIHRPSGWQRLADMPAGPKSKNVKDGGCLAGTTTAGSAGTAPNAGFVYGLKGNNRCEFYAYDPAINTWTTRESIPVAGRSGKKKAVKKGAALAVGAGSIFACKGNNTTEFWRYQPQADDRKPQPGGTRSSALDASGPTSAYPWTQLADVPPGAKALKEGAGAAVVSFHDSDFVYLLKGSGTGEFYRYSVLGNAWKSKAAAPPGLSGKPFKNGSCLATDGAGTIYALKGSFDEFFAYDVATDKWSTKAMLPLIGASGKKKKVKDGAGLASIGNAVYALKGDNTTEFWQYRADSGRWMQLVDLPIGSGKRVKGGGALASCGGVLFALKGNNSLEFWSFTPALYGTPGVGAMADHSLNVAKPDLWPGANPSRGLPAMQFSLPRAGEVSLRLYDLSGRLVATCAQGRYAAGSYRVKAPRISTLAPGIYVLRFAAPGTAETRKLVIVE